MIALLADLIVSGSIVSLGPTDYAGAIAEVTFDNRTANSAADNGHYSVTDNGLTVGVAFTWNTSGDNDTVTLAPPDGVACVPSCVLEVPEREAAKVLLIEWVGF